MPAGDNNKGVVVVRISESLQSMFPVGNCLAIPASDEGSALFAAGKRPLVALRNHGIKPYIPRIWRNFLDFLTLER